VIGERAAIAVLGPMKGDGPRVTRAGELSAVIGAQLARLGYALVVHGPGVTAQAATRAARQVDGFVVAVGAEGLDMPGASVEARPTSLQALERVLELADAVILLPGDLHAVALLMGLWSWGLEPDAPFRQVILVGDGWPETVRTLADAVGLDQKTRAMVTFAREAPEAVEALRYYVAPR
jgi:predicted Rossmann-fold nucleotide-binding protein